MKGKVVKVLTWRWDQELQGTDEMDHTMSPEKKVIKKDFNTLLYEGVFL